ncbi:MAG: M81 family metallopeptidase [Planctomycetota bacterium]
MRIALVGLYHESNTFAKHETAFDHFVRYEWLEGQDFVEAKRTSHNEGGGMLEVLEADAEVTVVPLLYAAALPAGRISADAERKLWSAVRHAVTDAGPFDGVLAMPHGAAVGATQLDFDGWWLEQLRGLVGPDVPIVATLDPHANVSPRMVAAVDALLAYRTNPHVDQRQVGREAATLLLKAVRGECELEVAWCSPPLLINIERQLTSTQPTARWLNRGTDLANLPGVLSTSLILGYPYADVPEMGCGTLVVTDRRKAAARPLAMEWAQHIWAERELTLPTLQSIDQALTQAKQLEGTIGLLDMGDNIGGGSYGDQTALAHALQAADAGPFFVNLADPIALEAAQSWGEGAVIDLRVGGRSEPGLCGGPLPVVGRVETLSEGRWTDAQPRHGGRVRYDMGPLAHIRLHDGSVVQISEHAIFPVSAGQMTHAGFDPRSFRALVLKGVHAPVAAYRELVDHLLRVDSPGPTSASVDDRAYRHRRRPMYPFEKDAAWSPASST